MKNRILKLFAIICSCFAMAFTVIPVNAEGGLGPYGDIYGYYTWEIDGKGRTIYSQNGYSWIYDRNGQRTYLDSYGNPLDESSDAASKTITQYRLTYAYTSYGQAVYESPDGQYYTVDNNGYLTWVGSKGSGQVNPQPSSTEYVADYVMYYSFTNSNGYNIFIDERGNYWWFGKGGVPNRYYGDFTGGWKDGIPNYTYYYAYKSSEGYYIYRDGYNNYWWFSADGTPKAYKGTAPVTPTPSVNPTPSANQKPTEVNVDWNHSNVLEADGAKQVVYVNQYWQAPTKVSWAPTGMRLIGWDWVENSTTPRWLPGAWIKNTGSDLYLFPVYSKS